MSEADAPTLPDVRETPGPSGRAPAADLGERYDLGVVLGRGGMGEVRIARDTRIHRDVAVKLLRSSHRDEETIGRFFREARVQGVLEHPSVVPVHDLGIDPAGNPYFVMKRLTGTTLADVIAAKDPDVRARWPRRVVLARFVDICLATEFAHTRGVIHRDLKPANLMLGDFGEAYVLDWGLARISDEREALPNVEPLSGDDLGQTAAGDMLGTPGYMSPEQARGEAVDSRTDVFALGCVLYEILAEKPALPRGMPGITATLASDAYRPSKRSADVPPELDDLCARATGAVASSRPTARQLADAIQAYLDGDRDLARRRDLSEQHAAAARTALRENTDEARATAMHEAGRALALDPANSNAQEIVGRLMLAAPKVMPAGAADALERDHARTRQRILQGAFAGYVVSALITLLLFVLPVRSYVPVIVSVMITVAAAAVVRHISRRPVHRKEPWLVVLLVLSSAMFVASGVMFGPLLVMPLFMVGAIAGFLAQPSDFHWSISVAGFVLPFVATVVLELVGILPTTMSFADGSLLLTNTTLALTPLSTTLIVGLCLATQIANVTFISLSRNAAQVQANKLVHAQRWHLEQLLPHADDEGTGPVPKS